MKKHVFVLLITLLHLSGIIYSQNEFKISEFVNIPKSAIDSMEMRINFLIKNHKKLSKEKKLQLFPIFFLSHNCGTTKEDLLDKNFWQKLKPQYYNKVKNDVVQNEYLCTEILICDSTGNCIATESEKSIFDYYIYDIDKYLANMLTNNEVDFIFKIASELGVYVCIKNNDIFVIETKKDGFYRSSWTEYINDNWDKLNFQCEFLDNMSN